MSTIYSNISGINYDSAEVIENDHRYTGGNVLVRTYLVQGNGHPLYQTFFISDIQMQDATPKREFKEYRDFASSIYGYGVDSIIGPQYPFPPTHKKSSIGIKLTQKEITERKLGLDMWVRRLACCYKELPGPAQDEFDNFMMLDKELDGTGCVERLQERLKSGDVLGDWREDKTNAEIEWESRAPRYSGKSNDSLPAGASQYDDFSGAQVVSYDNGYANGEPGEFYDLGGERRSELGGDKYDEENVDKNKSVFSALKSNWKLVKNVFSTAATSASSGLTGITSTVSSLEFESKKEVPIVLPEIYLNVQVRRGLCLLFFSFFSCVFL